MKKEKRSTSARAFIQKNKNELVPLLAEWFSEQKRSLPWREEVSVYKTVVSEFMLQQTRVETVLPYFDRWVKRFPDFASLANTTEEEVVKMWEGLGYYSRARNLRKLAIRIDEIGIPDNREDWLKMPGIGPYTSAAITSIAQGLPHAVVDGNVVRVMARLVGDSRAFSGNAEAVKNFEELAQSFLSLEHPASHNEAMMELGATVCTKGKALCLLCPFSGHCEAKKMGLVDEIPKIERRSIEKVTTERLWIHQKGHILFAKRSSSAKRLSNILEFPETEMLPKLKKGKEVFRAKRSISNQRIEEVFYAVKTANISINEDLMWVPVSDLEDITLSGPHRKWLVKLLGS